MIERMKRNDKRKEAIQEGRKEGMKDGRKEQLKDGIKTGRKDERTKNERQT